VDRGVEERSICLALIAWKMTQQRIQGYNKTWKRRNSCSALDGPFLLLLLCCLLLIGTAWAALPAGFEDEGVERIRGVVDIAFAGNIMLAVTKPGILYTLNLNNPDADSQEALNLSDRVCDNGERG